MLIVDPSQNIWKSVLETLKYWILVKQYQSYFMGGASLALVGLPSSDVVTIKVLYRVDVLLHQLFLHPIFWYWVG